MVTIDVSIVIELLLIVRKYVIGVSNVSKKVTDKLRLLLTILDSQAIFFIILDDKFLYYIYIYIYTHMLKFVGGKQM
jgi:hypothetical protein